MVASSAASNETVGTVDTADNAAVDGLVAVALEQSVLPVVPEVQSVPLWVEVQAVELQPAEVQPWPWE